jgi:hypothetical protein
MKKMALILLLVLSGCGYKFSAQQIDLFNAKGEMQTLYACGSYMQVSSEGWGNSNYRVSFTDASGMDHTVYGAKEVIVSDIPPMVSGPMWNFSEPYYPGERYGANADGTPGAVIKEGDIVVKVGQQARLHNGRWVPIQVPNPACAKQ